MAKLSINFILVLLISVFTFANSLRVNRSLASNKPLDEAGAIKYLEDVLEPEYSRQCNLEMTARWNYITDVTAENEKKAAEALTTFQNYQASVQAYINQNYADWDKYASATVKREFQFLASKGPSTMDPAHVKEMNDLRFKMESSYAEAKLCEYSEYKQDPVNCVPTQRLEPEIVEKLKTVKDFDELTYYWTGWHDKISKEVSTADYAKFISFQNELAKANNYANMGDLWAAPYDDGTNDWTTMGFEEEMLDIWEQLKPSYNKLHAYVRMKLRKNPQYAQKIDKFGTLPANLLGNMWAQDWTALDSETKPFPNAPSLDATAAMMKKAYTVKKMFEVSDEFFQGLGLPPMTATFWEKSLLERPPPGKEVVCHASAEDFCTGKGNQDFRIKMCTEVNQDHLVTVHHEMGHIAYFMEYTNEHYIFRDGANPGFHEAIGDALALAVTTPKHLQCILGLDLGLDIDCIDNKDSISVQSEVSETDINFLYIMALQKFAFFPFAISMDSWRWGVFNGSIPEADYNKKWWEIRERNQGISPPFPRTGTSGGLDAGAKYHIVANVEYIRYFISHILQFQFYESMCIEAKEYDPNDANSKPLYQCDFAGSKEAGKKFGDMMKLGFKEPWPVALKAITGSEKMDISSLKKYFEPLFHYIDKELAANGELAGFTKEGDFQKAAKYITEHYETEASKQCNLQGVADFAYQTDLNNPKAEEALNKASLAYAAFESKEYKDTISKIDIDSISNEFLKRQLKFMKAIGISALNSTDLERYNAVLSEMSKIYGTAKVCPFDNQDCDLANEGLALEPELTELLGSSKNYEELAYLWGGWRDATGKRMRKLYIEYVELSNKAAKANGYDNMGDFWLLRYELDTEEFRTDLEAVWQKLKKELYEPLYDHVRFKLSKKFPQINKNGPIEAHLLGNMWSQSWEHLLEDVKPSNAPSFDITNALLEKTKTIRDERKKREFIFDMANEFFTSLNLADMKVAYGDKAMILKPKDKEVICHASAWDMCDKKDFRLKMCTEINHEDFITAHHELGHIQYYLNYKNLPITYRTGANPGFHEAIGDVVALSVSTPKHLKAIDFIKDDPSEGSKLNFLMQMALEKIAFLPFGYLIDAYRWQVFNGKIPSGNLTYKWIKMRAEIQGVVPPSKRNELDFDPGAKYHVPANTPYIRYFVSFILQFQIHQKLCQVAGHPSEVPLSECDIYRNKAAGKLFKEILQAGGSENWQDLLERVTGERKLNPDAIISYFKPLIEYLKDQQASEKYAQGYNIGNIDDYFGDRSKETTTTTTGGRTTTAGGRTTTAGVRTTTAGKITTVTTDEPTTSSSPLVSLSVVLLLMMTTLKQLLQVLY